MLKTRRKCITTQPAFILLHSTLVRLIHASLCLTKTRSSTPLLPALQKTKKVLETNPDFDLQVAEDEHHRI
jgi:hypothetical protein